MLRPGWATLLLRCIASRRNSTSVWTIWAETRSSPSMVISVYGSIGRRSGAGEQRQAGPHERTPENGHAHAAFHGSLDAHDALGRAGDAEGAPTLVERVDRDGAVDAWRRQEDERQGFVRLAAEARAGDPAQRLAPDDPAALRLAVLLGEDEIDLAGIEGAIQSAAHSGLHIDLEARMSAAKLFQHAQSGDAE